MKINYILDENNYIIGWSSFPLDLNLPIIEVENPENIKLGFDKVENNQYISNNVAYEEYKATIEAKSILLNQIRELKNYLASTDYQAIKYAEGELSAEEYAPVKEQRRAARAEINQLEAELANL